MKNYASMLSFAEGYVSCRSIFTAYYTQHADIAQLVERLFCKQRVMGSTPFVDSSYEIKPARLSLRSVPGDLATSITLRTRRESVFIARKRRITAYDWQWRLTALISAGQLVIPVPAYPLG